jgi:predicted HTH transcriptional regulator
MDTYQQYLTNAIYRTWPNINTLIQVTQPNYNGRNLVVVEVSPSSSPLSLEGSYYYRVGTETRIVTKEGEKEFLKRRPAQYESLKV